MKLRFPPKRWSSQAPMRGLSSVALGPAVKGAAILLALLLLGAVLGMLSAVMPPLTLLVLGSLPLALLMAAVFPMAAFVAVLLMLFGLLPEFLMTAIPLGSAMLRPPEIVLIVLVGVIALRSLGSLRLVLEPARPLRLLLAVLVAGLLVGLVFGKVMSNNRMAMADARQFLGWLALPIALWITAQRKDGLHWIVIGLALVAGAAMAIQLLTGVQIIYGFRGAEALGTGEFNDVTRSEIGGGLFFLAYAAYALFAHACHSERYRWLALAGCVVASFGIVASFNRANWAGFALGALVFLVCMPRLRFSRVGPLLLLLTMSAVSAAVVSIAVPRVAEAIAERVQSLTDEGGRGSSLGFRFDENSQALAALRKSPILGKGMGGEYKTSFRQAAIGGGFNIENIYIHNGYLSLWLKLGVLGLLFPPLLLFTVWQHYRKVVRNVVPGSEYEGAQAAAIWSVLVMLMVSTITSPDWTSQGGTAALSIMLAILVTRSLNQHDAHF